MPVTIYGPFSVNAEAIERLRAPDFAPLVTRLLAVEAAAAGMEGTTLESTYRENTPDGGVDAGLQRSEGTPWIPAGTSAWQFKAGDLPPAKCRSELDGATHALDVLRDGGSYRLVLGDSLTPQQIARRRSALCTKAVELGITLAEGTIDVITADGLARWLERYPALAADPILGGIGHVGRAFNVWAKSSRLLGPWATSESRERAIAAIHQVLESGTQHDIHIEGVSGLGKTRLALEALRGHAYEPLTVYAPAADEFPSSTLSHLQAQGRTAVVVVDECDSRRHEVYAMALTTDTSIRLITMGESAGGSTRSPMLRLGGLEEEAMGRLLQSSEPSLWPQARSVIVELAAGNVDYALKAARALLTSDNRSAGSLAIASDIRKFITAELPEGALFLGSGVLALFSSLGFDDEVAFEVAQVAISLGILESDLRAAARQLERRGLISRQGRFRSVGPHPVALYLASAAWAELGTAIVDQLLPELGDDMAERLFRRAADIGDPELARLAVSRAMASDGPLGSWEALSTGKRSRMLGHVAILAPLETTIRLEALIGGTPEDELAEYKGVRRDLVWALEKLVWHSETFEAAADLILRLALAEIEAFSNNATGTWVGLFATLLPATAATPEVRASYLEDVARSSDPRIRALAVKAATRALEFEETTMVSGEQQGGAIVEPRGTPATFAESWQYRNRVVDLLTDVAVSDSEPNIVDAALTGLAAAIHPSLGVPLLRTHLGEALSRVGEIGVRRARQEIESLRGLFTRVEIEDGRAEGLDAFAAQLPEESAEDRLRAVVTLHSWDREDGQLANEIRAAALAAGPEAGPRLLIEILESEEPAASFDIGRVLAVLSGRSREHWQRFQTEPFRSRDALVGYLWELTSSGDNAAFDDFIDELNVDALTALRLTARGPYTPAARDRIAHLVDHVLVADAARLAFSWGREEPPEAAAKDVDRWLERMASQEDYSAVLDYLALRLHKVTVTDDHLRETITALLNARRQFPNVGREGWDWIQLARHVLPHDPEGLTTLILDLVEEGAVSMYEGSEDLSLLQAALKEAGVRAWDSAMKRVQSGSWRLAFAGRGWLAGSVEVSHARAWVGTSLERARTLASVATLGGNELDETAQFLLTEFGDDERVSGSLYGEFMSGTWWGPESARIEGQIDQVKGWLSTTKKPKQVQAWLRQLVASLEEAHSRARQREAEERF